MSEFLRLFKERAEAEAAPLRRYLGEESAAAKLADNLIAIAVEIEQQLSERRFPTAIIVERTGWSAETLQKWARAKLAGEAVPAAWRALDVQDTGAGYLFAVDTVPAKSRSADAA